MFCKNAYLSKNLRAVVIFTSVILKQDVTEAQLMGSSGIDAQFADGGIIAICHFELSWIITDTKDDGIRIQKAVSII